MGFEKSTAFIVGAGAHVDYEMPTGLDIVLGLRGWCDGTLGMNAAGSRRLVPAAIYRAFPHPGDDQPTPEFPGGRLKAFEQNIAKLRELSRRLSGSPHDSIDALLAQWPEYGEIGKRTIAAIIALYQEQACKRPMLRGWHHWLAQQCQPIRLQIPNEYGQPLASRSTHWDFRNINVATFNYDLLFEIHMETLMRNWGPSQPPIDKLPRPWHIYGSLTGTPEWNSGEMRICADASTASVVESSNAIRIADGRGRPNPEELEQFRILGYVDQLVFLGFAFDKSNLMKLGLFPGSKTMLHRRIGEGRCKVFATAFRLGERQKEYAQQAMGAKIDFGGDEEPCVDCLTRWKLE